jgi:hypothetical protein
MKTRNLGVFRIGGILKFKATDECKSYRVHRSNKDDHHYLLDAHCVLETRLTYVLLNQVHNPRGQETGKRLVRVYVG